MNETVSGLAVVTGASSGIGYQLAASCIEHGFAVIIAADEPEIEAAAATLRQGGGRVEAVQADLSGPEGVETLYAAIGGRRVDALLANAGRALGHAFLDQAPADWLSVINTNVVGTLLLVHRVGRGMRAAGAGRILITGSIAGFLPGTFMAVYNGSKAFLDSFAVALRHELKGSGVSVTCLMPGATETEIFERADMQDTKVGQQKKDDPATVAKTGFDAMMAGEESVVVGWKNKVQAAVAHVAPSGVLAELHRSMAQPDG